MAFLGGFHAFPGGQRDESDAAVMIQGCDDSERATMIACAVLATRTWPVFLVWLLAIGQMVFAARVGADARIPTVVAWSGLAVACALVLWGYVRGRLAIVRPAHQVNLSR